MSPYIDLLCIWLPKDIIKRIVGILPPYPASRPDRIVWTGMSLGSFLVRSAFWSLKESSWEPKDERGNHIQIFLGSQRVQFFLQLVSKQRLLANAERTRRGLANNSLCSLCGHDNEDVIHVLRDCLATKDVWMHVLPPDQQNMFISTPLQPWLFTNIGSHLFLQDHGTTWSILFDITLWCIQ